MTATMPGLQVPDPYTVLKRADDREARRAGDDPLPAETISEFGRAVQEQIVQPLLAQLAEAQRGAGSSVELEELRAELAEAQQAARHSQALADQWEREHQNTVLPYTSKVENERDQALAELNRLGAELRASRDQLARVMKTADDEAATLKARIAELEQLPERHEHRYLWNRPGELPQPCACGQPYPRAHLAEPREDVPAAEPEPWADIFAGLRSDLADCVLKRAE